MPENEKVMCENCREHPAEYEDKERLLCRDCMYDTMHKDGRHQEDAGPDSR